MCNVKCAVVALSTVWPIVMFYAVANPA